MRKKQSGSSNKSYAVGYGRPPKEHQFKPRQTGNAKGRPKGRKNEATILDEILHRKIEIREKGRTRTITVLEGMLLKFAEDALKGNSKAAAFLLGRYGGVEPMAHDRDELSGDEQKIIDDYVQRLQSENRKKRKSS